MEHKIGAIFFICFMVSPSPQNITHLITPLRIRIARLTRKTYDVNKTVVIVSGLHTLTQHDVTPYYCITTNRTNNMY